MAQFRRILDLELPPGQSAFLWGARQTGKTTLLRERFPDSLYFDLLDTDLFLELSRRPAVFAERISATPAAQLEHPILIDEVQKVPALLDEVHRLIESKGLRFLLSGSSARKLKRQGANLLGGRAWRLELLPLCYPEYSSDDEELDLLRILDRGLLPRHIVSAQARRSQRAYVQDYLKQEVFDEALTRNIPAFTRFFESMAYSHGELTVFANSARDSGVDAKTVKENYNILVDSLVGHWVPPFKRRQERNVIVKASKFYLFDVGLAGSLVNRSLTEVRGEAFGHAFEHFVFMELRAYVSYRELDCPIAYWRTKNGHEVDFVLADAEVAIEVKGSQRVDSRELRSLRKFMDRYSPRQAIVVCNEPVPRESDGIRVLPWRMFLEELWSGGLIS